MVAAVDHRGVVGKTGLAKRRHDLSDIMVEPADQPVIGDERAAAFIGVSKARFRFHHGVLPFHPGMHPIAGGRMKLGFRQIHPVVDVIKGLRADKREMRRDKPDIEAPSCRPVGRVAKPVHRAGGDRRVIAGVGAFAGADFCAKHAATPEKPLILMPDRGPDHADAVLYHHRDVKPVEPAVILRVAIVKLADGLDGNTRILKLVPPSPRGAGIGAGIVPMASLVDIAAGGESGTRRNADRRRRVGVGEA